MISLPIKSKLEIAYSYVDFEDLHLAGYKWYLSSGGYAYRNRSKTDGEKYPGIRLLHHDIQPISGCLTVDHINGNKLDNRRDNLRLVTPSQQNQNSPIRKNNKSNHLGVYRRKDCDRWAAFIQKEGNHIYLGLFKNLDDAITARKKAEKELFGDFRRYK